MGPPVYSAPRHAHHFLPLSIRVTSIMSGKYSETEDYSQFRIKLLTEIVVPTFVLPPLLCAAFIRILSSNVDIKLGIVLTALACLVSIPLSLFVRVQLQRRRQRREARKLDARIAPRLQGKWIGNLDVLMNIISSPRQKYLMDGAKDLMIKLGSNTINTNILWVDQVTRYLLVPPKC